MKKLIGYLAAHLFYYIGEAFCKIGYCKIKGKFLFDKPRLTKIGNFVFNQYQVWMHYSSSIQDWAGNETPWKRVLPKDIEVG